MTRGLNKLWDHNGTVFDDRYHEEILKTPRQTRAAICYVLQNARKHGERLPAWAAGIDPFSSAWYFDGWRDDSWRDEVTPSAEDPPVARSSTWLMNVGWRRHGLIAVDEVPGRR